MRARNLSEALAVRADQIVPQLLPSGKRAGNYWQAGDVGGGAGTSLYVHMAGVRRGHWRDAATGEHGDLLDLIAVQNRISLSEAMIKAEELLGGGHFSPIQPQKPAKPPRDTRRSALKLWERARPILTPYAAHGQAYFEARGIKLANIRDLRFHKAAWVDVTNQTVPDHYPVKSMRGDRRIATLPAVIAAVRDVTGELVAVHRTFLDPVEPIKAQIDEPKRALGLLTGGGCWLRRGGVCLIVAEGLETALSLGGAFPKAALAAGITAHHLTEMTIHSAYERVLIAADNDDAGRRAASVLTNRLEDRFVITVFPRLKDFNDDLIADGLDRMKRGVTKQVAIIKSNRERGVIS
jgi:hypothetical protein